MNHWCDFLFPSRYLTAFKAENPNARKKTKFDYRNHHFSFSPRLFTRSIHAPQSSPTQSSSAEPWLAVKLIRSIRCDRHLRKHVENEACNLVFNVELLTSCVWECYTEIYNLQLKSMILCLKQSKLTNYFNFLFMQQFRCINFY